MINALISFALLAFAWFEPDCRPLYLIAAGAFAVAAEISHYRYERFKEDITDEV